MAPQATVGQTQTGTLKRRGTKRGRRRNMTTGGSMGPRPGTATGGVRGNGIDFAHLNPEQQLIADTAAHRAVKAVCDWYNLPIPSGFIKTR